MSEKGIKCIIVLFVFMSLVMLLFAWLLSYLAINIYSNNSTIKEMTIDTNAKISSLYEERNKARVEAPIEKE